MAAVVTTNDFHDSEVLPDLLEATEANIKQVLASVVPMTSGAAMMP